VAVLEATRNWYWLYELLEETTEGVRLCHPAKARLIAESKVKTDRIDGRVLAQLARTLRRAFRERRLVTDGYYAYCRHPVYALSLVWISGIMMVFRSWLLLIVPVVAYVAMKLLIEKEERFLEEEFGEAFLDYKKKVNPLFPTRGKCPFRT